jgi:hypothetical protein
VCDNASSLKYVCCLVKMMPLDGEYNFFPMDLIDLLMLTMFIRLRLWKKRRIMVLFISKLGYVKKNRIFYPYLLYKTQIATTIDK